MSQCNVAAQKRASRNGSLASKHSVTSRVPIKPTSIAVTDTYPLQARVASPAFERIGQLPYGGPVGDLAEPADAAPQRRAKRIPALELHVTTSMFGRAAEQSELLAALSDPAARLVTLTGRGGVGKTRLALEVIRILRERAAPPLVTVSLAGTTRPELVIGEIAAAFGVPLLPNVDMVDAVADRIRGDELLVVLDNFEQVLDAAPVLSDLLERCAGLKFLVTSQAPLRLQCERVLAIDPLPVPERGEGDPSVLAAEDAVATYCARAAAVDRSFELEASNALAVGELCRQVDGLPLAIELAAARVATLPAAAILSRLDTTGLDLLRRARGDAPARHHDLRAAIDWTYQLLAARRAVLDAPALVDLGNVRCRDRRSAQQFDELRRRDRRAQRARRPASRRSAPGPRTGAVPDRIIDPGLRSRAARAHRRLRVHAAHAHHAAGGYRAAPRAWARHPPTRSPGSRCSTPTTTISSRRSMPRSIPISRTTRSISRPVSRRCGIRGGFDPVYEELLERTLKLGANREAASAAYANVLIWSGLLGLRHRPTEQQVERVELVDRLQRGEELARALGDDQTLLRALVLRMRSTPYTGDFARAQAASAEGLELAARTSEERSLGEIEAWSGMLAQQTGNDERAIALGLSAVARARRYGDPRTLVLATMLLVPLRRNHPEIGDDVPPPEEALLGARATGLTLYEALLLPMIIGDAAAAGDRAAALRWAAESLTMARSMPGTPIVGYNLMSMLRVAAVCDDAEAGAYFHGVVRDDVAALSQTLAPQQVRLYEATIDHLRSTLGADRFEAEAARGAALAPAAAIEEALRYVHDAIARFAADDQPSDPVVATATPDALTARQREVLGLLVAGLGNKEIAARLGVSTKTVMHHTTAIYRTLGVRGRAEAAVLAIRAELVD